MVRQPAYTTALFIDGNEKRNFTGIYRFQAVDKFEELSGVIYIVPEKNDPRDAGM